MQKCGITHQVAMQQKIQEKEDIVVEGAEVAEQDWHNWLKEVATGEVHKD